MSTRNAKHLAPRGLRKNETLLQLHARILQSFKKSALLTPGRACFPERAIVGPRPNTIKTVVWCGGMGTVEAASLFVPEICVVGNVEKSAPANAIQNLIAGDGVPLGQDIYFYTEPGNVYPFDQLGARLLIISAPCQDFSSRNVAKAGFEGEDGDVLQACLDALRLAIDAGKGPELVIIENVPGICHKSVKLDKPAPIVQVMDEFYDMGFECVCSRALDSVFCGVPMHREREFIVAALKGTQPLDILYNEVVITPCDGNCKVGDRWCFEHWKQQQEAKQSSANSPYLGYMHCAQTHLVHDVLSHLTASSGEIAMVGPGGAYAGALADEHITSLMGLPSDLLSGVKSRSAKITLLGNAIQVNVLIWLLQRVVTVCNSDGLYKKTTIKRFLNKHGNCIDDVVVRFRGFSWADGSRDPGAEFKTADTMPLNCVNFKNVGSFEVINAAPNPPGQLFSPIEDIISTSELKKLPPHQWYGWLYRLTRNGVVIDADLISRLKLWSGPSDSLIFPPICQKGLPDKGLFFEIGMVYVEPLKLWFGAELMKTDSRRHLGRDVPAGFSLKKGQYYAMISPVNYSGTSKTANLLNLPAKYSSWFLVNEGVDCHLSGTPGAVKVTTESRVVAIQAVERGDTESMLIFSLFDDATVWINDIAAARRRLPGSSMSQTLRHLRSIAVKSVLKSPNLGALQRNVTASVYMGSTGAYLTQLGKEAIGFKIKMHWNGTTVSGTVVDFLTAGMKTLIKIDGSENVQQYHLAGHQCLVESFVEIKKKRNPVSSSAPQQNINKRVKSTKVSTPIATDSTKTGKKKGSSATNLLPQLDYSARNMVGSRVIGGDGVDVVLIDKTHLNALRRMCLQDYFNYGDTTAIHDGVGTTPGDADMLKVAWQSIGVTQRPTSFYKILGLYGSTRNWGMGGILETYFIDLYKCAGAVYRHLVEHSQPGVDIKLSLSFAAPDCSSEGVKEIMPILSRGSTGRLFPHFADITAFDKLDTETKKQTRFEMLCSIYRAKGALPARALPGANAMVTFWRDGLKITTELEIPSFKMKFLQL